ncbi:MAG: hypothetical protein GMKNLPBB_00326 [Myxococcota bacterium]|nr:hypothetical protein [Myxococcota bacterium]
MPAPISHTPSHLLLFSDVHLGEHLKEGASFGTLRNAIRKDERLVQLVRHYRLNPRADMPWKLILNGDIIDFPAITARPRGADAHTLTSEEREFGPSSRESSALFKLRLVMKHHHRVFRELARFVLAGNELVYIRGNHDVEMYWPSLKQAFADGLVRLALEESSSADEEALRRRIGFRDWFYHEPGLIYVEHGQQYDEYTSFDSQLEPRHPEDPGDLDLPASHGPLRYIANQHQIDSHDMDSWNAKDYFLWVLNMGLKRQVGLAAAYFTTIFRQCWGLIRRAPQRERNLRVYRARHQQLLAEEAERQGMNPEQLRAIDSLRKRPAGYNVLGIFTMLCTDKVALPMIGGLLALGAMLLHQSWAIRIGLMLITAVASVLTGYFLSAWRDSHMPPKLRQAAGQIAGILDVQWIVMGHSHAAEEAVFAGGQTRYINLGHCIPDSSSPLTHLIISPGRISTYRFRSFLTVSQARVRRQLELIQAFGQQIKGLCEPGQAAMDMTRQALDKSREALAGLAQQGMVELRRDVKASTPSPCDGE